MSTYHKLEEVVQKEQKLVAEFRNRVEDILVKDEYKEEYFLARWLVARELDVDKAEEMIRKALKWRLDESVDGLLDRKEDDFPDKYRRKFMFGVFGEDMEGYPILLLPCGRHDHRSLIEVEGMDKLMHWNVVWIEKVMAIVKTARERHNKPIHQYHEILDMEGYSYRQLSFKPGFEYIMKTQTFFDTNYPEILRTITIINAPRVFPILFNFLKPFLSQQTLNKISIFGCDEVKWKEHFREKFPMDRFPPRYGGTLKGEDEFCSQEDVWVDNPIPLRYFKDVEGEDEEGFLSVEVAARNKFKVDLEIGEKNTRVEWTFQTQLHDIAFGVIFQNTGNKDIGVGRVPSNKELQQGTVICNTPGKVTLVFDNKYSYTTAKSLRYKINIVPPPADSSSFIRK